MKLTEIEYYRLTVVLLEKKLTYNDMLTWLETKDLKLNGIPRALIGIGEGERVIERIREMTNTCYACKINCGNDNCFTNRDNPKYYIFDNDREDIQLLEKLRKQKKAGNE